MRRELSSSSISLAKSFFLTKNKVVANNPIIIDKKAFQQKGDFNDSANLKNIPDSLPVKVPTAESITQVLARISRDRRFWLMLAGKAALMTVGQFISFIPLYLNTGKPSPSFTTFLCECLSINLSHSLSQAIKCLVVRQRLSLPILP